jgi:hypothetical protein
MRSITNRLPLAAATGAAMLALALPTAALAQDAASVRVLHGSPDAPAVDVYADGAAVLENVPFGVISDYLEVPAGEHRFQVVPTGASLEEGPVVIDATVTLEPATMTTVAATNALASIEAQVIADAPAPTADGTQVRVVHLSADSPAVDVALDGGDVVVPGAAYPAASDYLSLPAGEYDLEIRPAGTSDVAFDIDPLTLDAGTAYSAFAIGSLADATFTVLPAVDAMADTMAAPEASPAS